MTNFDSSQYFCISWKKWQIIERWQTEAWTTWWVQHRLLRITRPLSRPFRCAYSRLVFKHFRKNPSPKRLKVKKLEEIQAQNSTKRWWPKCSTHHFSSFFVLKFGYIVTQNCTTKQTEKWTFFAGILQKFAIKGFWGQKLRSSMWVSSFSGKTQAFWRQNSTIVW